MGCFCRGKGGGFVKFHVEVVKSINSGSLSNVHHIYNMFEEADTLESIREQTVAIQKDDFGINGRKVKVFLAGHFYFLDYMLGHQGSASTYPSSLDLVALEHSRIHGGNPHKCKIPLRCIEDYT